MATTKKNPAAKSTAARKSTVKTTHKSAAKTPAKVVNKSTPKKHAAVSAQSFRPSKESAPFMTFTFTLQSLYWLILSVLVLALGAWVMYLNVQIQDIYDQVELNTQQNQSYMMSTEKKAQ